MKINKKLSTAIVLSLMLGVYGSASAEDRLYGNSNDIPVINPNFHGSATTIESKATSSNSEFEIISGTWDRVCGGKTENGHAKNNTVNIKGGTFEKTGSKDDSIYGGYAKDGFATSNTVEVNGSVTIKSRIYGGYVLRTNSLSTEFAANGNSVSIFGVSLGSPVYGGYVEGGGTAEKNEVSITGSTIDGEVSGGYISISGLRVKKTGNVSKENKVSITGSTITGDVSGGYIQIINEYLDNSEGTVNGNEVEISQAKGSTTKINGNVYGGWTRKGDALNNTVTVTGGTIEKEVVGGHASIGLASENTVTIVGGQISSDVCGGRAYTGSAIDNIVNFGIYEAGKAEGIANVTGNVFGGEATTSTGNTLNVYTVGNKVGDLQKFQIMNFYIPKEAAVGDVLVESAKNIDLANVKVLAGFHNDTALTNGNKVKLIKAPVVNGFDGVSTDKVAESDFTNFDIRVYQGNDAMDQVTSGTATSLVAEIVGKEANENSKSLVETIAVGTAIIAEGGDLLAGAGLANAQTALANDAEQGAPAGSATLFGAINANKSKIKSGSHVDVKGMNLNLGLVKEIKNNAGKFIVGPVVEYGKGKYDSYLDNGYHGEGDSHFVGGGLVAKQNNNNGMYYEGSVRAGKLMSDYKSNGGNYDSDSTYLAAHLGLGKVVKLNEKNSLDYYGKYFYSHQGSDDTTLHSALDHALHFDGVDSHRTRLGGRLNHVVKENNEVYIGFAWQHEFSSTARATIDGLGTPAPSCKGDTGIMELGWKVSETNKYDVDLGATGSIGKKKGAGVNLNFNWKF